MKSLRNDVGLSWFGLWCLTPLPTIFQLHQEYSEKTTSTLIATPGIFYTEKKNTVNMKVSEFCKMQFSYPMILSSA
jgi:hypothetical protein